MEGESQKFTYLQAIVIFITIAMLGFFLVFLAIIMHYLKIAALTIKTILKAAFETNSPFLAFSNDIKTIRHTKLRKEVEENMKEAQKDMTYFTKWTIILHSCKRTKQPERSNEEMAKLAKFKNKNFNLLQPPSVFYLFLYMLGLIIVWLFSGLFAGIFSTDLINNYVPYVLVLPLIVSVLSTIVIIFFIHVFHYVYLHNVRSAFK